MPKDAKWGLHLWMADGETVTIIRMGP